MGVVSVSDQDGLTTTRDVRGLDAGAALAVAGAPAGAVAAVTLPQFAAGDEQATLLADAVGAQPGDLELWLGFEAGEWTVVLHEGMPLVEDPTVALSGDGREALSCSTNIEGDTHLRYAVDGGTEFFVLERISVYAPGELPERLRAAAEAGGIYERSDAESGRCPAENFRVIGELAGLLFPLDALRRRPLLGARA